MKNDGFTLRKRLRSFRYAFHGIQLLIRHEHNAWIHCFAAVCVVTAGCLTGLSVMEWIAVIFAIGMVLAAEAVNSSIEHWLIWFLPTTTKLSNAQRIWLQEPY